MLGCCLTHTHATGTFATLGVASVLLVCCLTHTHATGTFAKTYKMRGAMDGQLYAVRMKVFLVCC